MYIELYIEELEHIAELFKKAPTGANPTVDMLRERAIIRIQRYLKQLHGADFTAALDLAKETIPHRYTEVTGYANF